MLAIKHYPNYHGAMPNHELLERYKGRISLHRAKTGYIYSKSTYLLEIEEVSLIQ